MTGFETEILGRRELERAGLVRKGWRVRVVDDDRLLYPFDPDPILPILGRTFPIEREVRLSITFVQDNGVEAVREILLHEVAHAIADVGAGHGPQWKLAAVGIGASGKVRYRYKVKDGKLLLDGFNRKRGKR